MGTSHQACWQLQVLSASLNSLFTFPWPNCSSCTWPTMETGSGWRTTPLETNSRRPCSNQRLKSLEICHCNVDNSKKCTGLLLCLNNMEWRLMTSLILWLETNSIWSLPWQEPGTWVAGSVVETTLWMRLLLLPRSDYYKKVTSSTHPPPFRLTWRTLNSSCVILTMLTKSSRLSGQQRPREVARLPPFPLVMLQIASTSWHW